MASSARLIVATLLLALAAPDFAQANPTSSNAHDSTAPLNSDTYFGMNGVGYFHRPDDTDDLNHRWELMKELGVRWDRCDFWWSDIETAPGKWDYRKADAAMKAYRNHGVQMLPILNYGARWRDTRGPSNDEERAEWASYVRNVVGRYRGYCNYWEVWNEPNIIPFWRPQPKVEDYAMLLKLTAKVAREANPDVKLVGFVAADLDLPFIQRVLELNGTGDFDVASFHFYRMDIPEEKTPEELREFRLLLRHFGKKCPIWVTENGVTSYFKDGVSEDLQAIRWMRQNLAMIEGGADRIFPFTLIDNLGDPGGEWGLQLGMVRRDGTKKPVFNAYKTMVHELNDFVLVGPVHFGESIRALLFKQRNGNATKLAAWSLADARDIKITFNDSASTSGLYYTTLLGEKHPLEWSGSTARLMLTPAPVYIPVDSSEIFVNASTHWQPGSILSSPGYTDEAVVSFVPGNIPEGDLQYKLPDGWTGQEVDDRYNFHVPAQAKPGWYTIEAQIPFDWGTIQKDLHVWVREPMEVTLRPHATTASTAIEVRYAVHNNNLKSPLPWSFDSEPAIQGVRWPSGTLASGEGASYFSEGSTTITQEQVAAITTTTQVRFVAGDFSRRAFQFAVTPITKTAPAVDGDLSEYAAAPPMVLGFADQLQRGKYEGTEDAHAVIRALWSADGLYIAADVTDDQPMMNDYGAGPEVYNGDGVEVYIGPAGYTGQYYADKKHGAYHFCLTPGNGGEGAAVSDFEGQVKGSAIAVLPRAGGYIIEAFIPRDAFGNFTPKPGDIIAWDVQLNDRDDHSRSAESKSFMWNGNGMNWLKAEKWGMAIIK